MVKRQAKMIANAYAMLEGRYSYKEKIVKRPNMIVKLCAY
jgi:hypothetical protein